MAGAAPEPLRRSDRMGQRRGEANPEPSARSAASAPSGRSRGRGGSERPDQPVVGMGDHVPLFMRRPVPQIEPLPEPVDD